MGMQTVKRGSLKRRKRKGGKKFDDGLPHQITPAMIARAEKAMERNRQRIESGETYRGHQISSRSAPSRNKGSKYS